MMKIIGARILQKRCLGHDDGTRTGVSVMLANRSEVSRPGLERSGADADFPEVMEKAWRIELPLSPLGRDASPGQWRWHLHHLFRMAVGIKILGVDNGG